jgi:hypothetical protein
MAVVTSPVNSQAIKITTGGTYSGAWSSSDPNVAAVTILTDEPVVIENATVTGKGDLISIYGSSRIGAHVAVKNVTGTALDPGVAGTRRGLFVGGQSIATLSVTQCTMRGVSFGVYVVSSVVKDLKIRDNVANNMEDRLSDGNGGFSHESRVNGHFIFLNGVVAPNGADISWNQMINTFGDASVEDVLNFYESHGAKDNVVYVHDNYLQGAFASGKTSSSTGGGIQMDGGSSDPATATGFIRVSNNVIVQTAGFGISIGAGHDISVTGNRIVSCGKDSSGNWIASPGSVALGMWNYYQTNQYFDNYIANNSGGLVRPDANGNPSPGDISAPSESVSLNNIVGTNVFEEPCLTSSGLNLAAESVERARWLDSVSSAGEVLGDQH